MSSQSALHKKQAHQLAREFSQRSGHGAFRGIDRLEVFDALDQRIDKPELISQGKAGLCGPGAILYSYALHDRVGYAKLVIHLFEHGRGRLRHWDLQPSGHLKHHGFSHKPRITPADWIALASIRDCENWFFDYQSASDDAATGHGEMVDILRNVGFHHVKDRKLEHFAHPNQKLSHEKRQELIDLLREADSLREQRYSVSLSVDSALLKDQPPAGKANHWVVLASKVEITDGKCDFKVFTWGKIRPINKPPGWPCMVEELVDYFYGFVAGRY